MTQGLSNRTVENSRLIADVTSQTQNLTAPHVSIVSTVIEQLTSEASTNPEVTVYSCDIIDCFCMQFNFCLFCMNRLEITIFKPLTIFNKLKMMLFLRANKSKILL